MKQEGIPFFVWYLEFKGAHELYMRGVIDHAHALMAGAAPLPPKRSFLGC
jgi:hypothetical protein